MRPVPTVLASGEEFMLLRRHGGLWAAPGSAVHACEAQAGERVILRLASGAQLEADQVLGMVRGLGVRSLGAVLRTCWTESARGLAVHAGEPCVVIDEAAPPEALRFHGGVASEVEE
ncbi:MAG: hypothetical protein ABI609_13485 [Acidobacteriota bacterium]